MESPLNLENIVAEFVTAYYTASVYDYRSVLKFYDPEKALIYRQKLPNGKPTNVNEVKQFIVPNLRGHERLVVLNYTFNPLSINNNIENETRYLNVIVVGQIVKDEKQNLISHFSQFFTLEIINNLRVAIISDSLTIISQVNASSNNNTDEGATETNESTSVPASEILFEIDRRPQFLTRQNQSKRQQTQQQQNQQQQQDQQLQLNQESNSNQTTKSSNKKKSKNTRFVYTPE